MGPGSPGFMPRLAGLMWDLLRRQWGLFENYSYQEVREWVVRIVYFVLILLRDLLWKINPSCRRDIDSMGIIPSCIEEISILRGFNFQLHRRHIDPLFHITTPRSSMENQIPAAVELSILEKRYLLRGFNFQLHRRPLILSSFFPYTSILVNLLGGNARKFLKFLFFEN